MTPANKRTLSILGFACVIGICVGAFFVGKHAGSRKASPAAPPSSGSVRPSASTSPSPSVSIASSEPSADVASPPGLTGGAPTPGNPTSIPVRVSVLLSTTGQDPSVLLPSSCTITQGVATASGTFNRDAYGETYVRYGDVVELYVYSSPSQSFPTGTQLAQVGTERTVVVGPSGPWQIAVPLAVSDLQPAQCLVAIQSTHAFMGAGNAGG
jgi:hypothetical protein